MEMDDDEAILLDDIYALASTPNQTIVTSSFPQTVSPGFLARRNEALAMVEVAVQSTILILTVVGNAAVLAMIVSLSRHKDLGRMYTMIGHLSCADLFVAIFNLLPQLLWDVTHRFRGGRVLCKLVKYVQVVAMYASAYVLMSTAVDRYTAICHPMRSHTWTSTTAHYLVIGAWVLALVFAVPQLVIFDYVEVVPGSGVYDCVDHFRPRWTLPVYITWFALAVYVIPLVVLATIYLRICVVVWKSANRKSTPMINVAARTSGATEQPSLDDASVSFNVADGGGVDLDPSGGGGSLSRHAAQLSHRQQQQQANNVVLSRAKTKTVKLTLTVVISYLVCWAPFFVSHIWSAWDPHAPFEGTEMVITLLLGSLNSCINPWIYLAFSDQLRRKVTQCCPRSWGQRPSTLSHDSTDFRSGSRPTHS
uniref:Annetocin receptor n=1 Tax=Eisenia fetida TaxID=6396 RepID=ANR_EISFE|nr:RecName: Full=Annetocin receptor [Eisenia fetida]BAD15088.1 annetocin receptor [Eisenia fetida]